MLHRFMAVEAHQHWAQQQEQSHSQQEYHTHSEQECRNMVAVMVCVFFGKNHPNLAEVVGFKMHLS
jgi:hypothetical protein